MRYRSEFFPGRFSDTLIRGLTTARDLSAERAALSGKFIYTLRLPCDSIKIAEARREPGFTRETTNRTTGVSHISVSTPGAIVKPDRGRLITFTRLIVTANTTGGKGRGEPVLKALRHREFVYARCNHSRARARLSSYLSSNSFGSFLLICASSS